MAKLEDVLFDYISEGHPGSNEHLKRFLRRFPAWREEIIDFTATWRALLVLERSQPEPEPEPLIERRIWKRAQARWRALHRRQAKEAAR
jgi:hypothetical protein